MALGLAGGGVSHYGMLGSHLCGSHSPSWTQGSPAGTGGQKHCWGKQQELLRAASLAQGGLMFDLLLSTCVPGGGPPQRPIH